jgi:hypothetical protein
MRTLTWLSLSLGLFACGTSTGPAANGSLAPWRGSSTEASAVPPLPKPRANHCSTSANGRIYVLGGNYKPAGAQEFVALDDIEVADQNPDGTLSAWRRAATLPSALTGCTAASDGQRVYVVGGLFENEAHRGRVWAATIAADGSLAAPVELGALPEGHTILSTHAFVRDGRLVVFDSTLSVEDGGPEGIVLLATSLTTPLAWTESRGPMGFRGRPQYAATSTHVYALGGYLGGDQGNEVVADGFGAPFDPTSGLGATFAASALPAPRAFGVGAAVDEWVFVLGGKTAIFNGSGQSEVYAAQVLGDGTLGPFSQIGSLPEGRTNLDAVVAGNYLYVTGGGSTGGGLDTVFSAQIRF